MKSLGVGVIGIGGIAGTHFPGWKASPHAELVALADTSPAILQRVGDEQGVGRRYESAQDLIADPDIDIVDICVPNAWHMPLAIAALEAGKHVLCEKPLGRNADEVRQMIAASDRSGKLLMTAQHQRFDGPAMALKAEIAQGSLGEIYHARAWMLRRYFAGITPAFARRELSGGGALIDIGVHILDLAIWLMGNPRPVTVNGMAHTRLAKHPGAFSIQGPIPADFNVDEAAMAWIRFDNDAVLMLEVSWLLHHPTDREDSQLWLYGDKGGAHWPSNRLTTTNYATQQGLDIQLKRALTGEPRARECMAFAEAVATGAASPVPAEQSLDVMRILDAIYASTGTGREVVL